MTESRKPQCEAIAAEFVRWTVQCDQDAIDIVTIGGDEFWVCAEHMSRATR